MSTPSGDAASVSVFVRVAPDRAFDAFTREIDSWWRHGPKFRAGRESRLVLEPGVGGRLFEKIERRSGPRTLEFGRVTLWEPPGRLAFTWRGVNFAPGEETLVEVAFKALNDGTLVTLRHSGWSAIRDDHPARHGNVGPDFSRFLGLWWGELLTSLRESTSERS